MATTDGIKAGCGFEFCASSGNFQPWSVWLCVHILFLGGFRKARGAVQWAWLFTFNQVARLSREISHSEMRPPA